MTCRYIYIGQKWTSADLKFGNGSVYLAGPRNRKGKSWRLEFIKKIESAGIECTILIPESANQLKGAFCRIDKAAKDKWQKFAISSATAICFWYPPDASDDVGVADLNSWYKSDRVFLGKDPENQTPVIANLLQSDANVTAVDSLDGLVEKIATKLNR